MNVPKLRFKEFNDEYKSIKLKDVSEIYDGTHETPNYVEKGVKFVSVENISNLLDTTKFIPESDYNKYKIKPKYNDVFMTRIGDIGTSSIYKSDEELAYYVSLALLRTKDNHILIPDYLNQYIKNNSFQKELYNRTIHVAFPKKINTGEIGECSINLCSDKEQLKVSNFLSLLDKKIELQSKKIEDLKLFKLYIRKKIFSSNTNNNIRLKEIVNCESSNITLADIENDNGIYPVYGATGFIKNIKNYKFDSEYIAIVKDGAGVGRTMICPKNSSILTTMNALTIKNNYPLNYICEMINTISFDKYIVGSGIPHIYFKDYGNEEFMLHNENDANKFDSVFKCLDRKIELLNVSLDKLNILKKGLMQGMFV